MDVLENRSASGMNWGRRKTAYFIVLPDVATAQNLKANIGLLITTRLLAVMSFRECRGS